MAKHQDRTPIFSAVKKYIKEKTIPFHVPGHKQGRGLVDFVDFVGENVLAMDLTCLPDTDNICNAFGVIREAEDLAAELYGASRSFFLVNGTTSGIQSMIMSICEPGDKVIMPRNVHKSAIGGLVLSGAVPVYLTPKQHSDFGIAMCVTPEMVQKSLEENPEAKGVFVVYPTYYGAACDLLGIVEVAHSFKVPVLVDEAHGAHFKFHKDLPQAAIDCGADLVATSTHKFVGSLTQSSILLLQGDMVCPEKVKGIMNLTQTTSPSYILLSSIDVARRQMALSGEELMEKTLFWAQKVRDAVREMPGYQLLGAGSDAGYGVVTYDKTKITIRVTDLGISGYEMERLLRQQYRIQVELSDLYNIIVIVTLGDNEMTIKALVKALASIAYSCWQKKLLKFSPSLPPLPIQVVTPREAFYCEHERVLLTEAEGCISAESIMAYPPGIPLLCPGERITTEIINYVQILKQEQAELQGTDDLALNHIKILKKDVFSLEPDYDENVQAG